MNKNIVLRHQLSDFVEKILQQKIQADLEIKEFLPEYGGDINTSFKIITTHGDFFMKTNDALLYPGMFRKEAKGLETIRLTETIYVPETIQVGKLDNVAFLILEYIEKGRNKDNRFWETFGQQLAEMHRHTNQYYGFDTDNYIGTLVQSNQKDSSWVNFFIEQRLKPQIRLATNRKKFDKKILSKFEKLFTKLYQFLPDELPHLLHGDLWSGNFLTSAQGFPVLIDPAVYYGHREMDLAMTKLFGGFDNRFYEAYNEAFPLLSGWQERVPIYQLYPLLVHVNLFGGSYIHSVNKILDRYI